jgi:hypothetical protein
MEGSSNAPVRALQRRLLLCRGLLLCERNYAERISAETVGVGDGAKPIGRKGHVEVVWRTTHADTAGYDSFIASINTNLHKHQWADW